MKTFIVMGCAKGGTSATAGVLKIHGIPMFGTAKTTDDHELLNHINNVPVLDKMIAERNQDGDWGLKHPDLWRSHARLQQHLTNPHWIFVYRDPIAVALHRREWADIKLNRATEVLDTYSDFLKVNYQPSIHISYEKLLFQPERTIRYICDFIERPFDERSLAFVKNTGRYEDPRLFME